MKDTDKYDFANDLSSLIFLIKKYDVPIELPVLYNLDSQFQYQDDFNVKLDNLVFTIDKKISGTIPYGIEMITIIFSHRCCLDANKKVETHDPICDYWFQLHICAYDSDSKQYVNWWHLDKNIESDPPKFTHPFYHLQTGGNELEGCDSGELVILGSPRIPHPPMDLFLGMHFVFNNFFSNKDFDFVKELLNDDIYKSIMIRAQQRMWEPYFNAYRGVTHVDYTMKNIFPLYMEY